MFSSSDSVVKESPPELTPTETTETTEEPSPTPTAETYVVEVTVEAESADQAMQLVVAGLEAQGFIVQTATAERREAS